MIIMLIQGRKLLHVNSIAGSGLGAAMPTSTSASPIHAWRMKLYSTPDANGYQEERCYAEDSDGDATIEVPCE
jgi:hypothetical protein